VIVLRCVACVQFGVAGIIAQVLKVQTAATLWRMSLVERVRIVMPRSVSLCCVVFCVCSLV